MKLIYIISKVQVCLLALLISVGSVSSLHAQCNVSTSLDAERMITKYLKNGENKVAVRVVGSLKNTFGPFYLKENRSIYGPFAWDKAPKHQPNYEKYFLKDYGLFEPFELLRSE